MLIYFIIFLILGVVLGLMAPKVVIPWVIGFVSIAFVVFNPVLAVMTAVELSAGAFLGLWLKSNLMKKQYPEDEDKN